MKITGISSMATRQLLAELAESYRRQAGIEVGIESVGGVDAARRVQAGEPFDFVVLAADAIEKLVGTGRVVADSRTNLVRSPVAVAVREGSPRPDIGSAQALRQAVLAAQTIGYSTGPSGTELLRLFERWGIFDALTDRLVQAPPGIPVGRLVAEGRVELGFQQLSEMMTMPGLAVVGTLPPDCAIVSTFTAGLCAGSAQPQAARALIAFMRSPATDEAKRRNGMEPA